VTVSQALSTVESVLRVVTGIGILLRSHGD